MDEEGERGKVAKPTIELAPYSFFPNAMDGHSESKLQSSSS
jgi:hypothetical protein